MTRQQRSSFVRLRLFLPAALVGAVIAACIVFTSGAAATSVKPTVVLVHGAWADGSSWNRVTRRLQLDGYPVMTPANPLRGVSSDSAYLASILATIRGPIVLVAHSYGGMVSTNAATGNPNVRALVYVAAFIPDSNESAAQLASKFPGGAPQSAIVPRPFPGGLDLYISPDQFRPIFAADLPAQKTSVMASAERPIALAAFTEPSGSPAWKTIPSWALVATDDHAIGTANAQFMAQRATRNVTDIDASHAVLISHSDAVENLIQTADLATR